jgi:hypothetical protein
VLRIEDVPVVDPLPVDEVVVITGRRDAEVDEAQRFDL